jgi:hypothetical protein
MADGRPKPITWSDEAEEVIASILGSLLVTLPED